MVQSAAAAAAVDDSNTQDVIIPQASSSSYGPAKRQHLPSLQSYAHNKGIFGTVQHHSGEIVNPGFVERLRAQAINQPSTSSADAAIEASKRRRGIQVEARHCVVEGQTRHSKKNE
jgi:hypothetical protein